MQTRATSPAPRGRHAPPIEVRRTQQRARLLRAAAVVFARVGYAEASAEMIAREAGMSKATFYEHVANKEECILELFDESAAFVLQTMTSAARNAGDDPAQRLRAGLRAFLEVLAEHPEETQTLLVEIIGAGPRASERRDAILEQFAAAIVEENDETHARSGFPRFASEQDVMAIVGAMAELASRQLRLGVPSDVRELEPVATRLILGLLHAAQAEQA